MRLRELGREAWRNTAAGASRPIISLLLFIILVGSLSVVQVLQVIQLNRDAAMWRESGASVQIITMTNSVDGVLCDSLATVNGVVASGALRAGPRFTPAALPSAELATLEASPGFADVADVQPLAVQPGAWVSEDLALVLGHPDILLTAIPGLHGEQVALSGIYGHAEDGRLPILAYTLVSPVPVNGLFDSCWVEIWPESASLELLLTYPVTAAGQADETPRVQQFNASLGMRFDAQSRLERIPTWAYLAASTGVGAIIGWAATRSRRLELASQLHAGVDKSSVCLQVAVEFMLWAVPAASLTGALLVALSTWGNPEPMASALLPGLRVLALGLVAAFLGQEAATLSVSENHLFRYFKNR